MNKDKLVKTLKTNIPLWNRYRRCFPCEASTLIDLRGVNLRGADFDYSTLPLWCGSFGIKVSKDFTEQLLLHIYKLDSNHPEFSRIKEFIEPYIKNCATVIKHNIEF